MALILQLDQLIRDGRMSTASALLAQARPRELRPLERARFYRRLGRHSAALQTLRPLVWSRGAPLSHPPAKATLEYALNLSELGLLVEAKQWLDRASDSSPEAEEARGFLALRRLDFAEALRAFEARRTDPRLTPYARQVAALNRLIALLGLFQYESVLEEGDRLEPELRGTASALLLDHLRSLRAQAAAYRGDRARFRRECQSIFRFASSSDPIPLDRVEFYRARAVGELYLGLPLTTPLAQVESALSRTLDRNSLYELAWLTRPHDPLLASVPEAAFFRRKWERIRGTPGAILPPAPSRGAFRIRLKPGQLPERLLTALWSRDYHCWSAAELHELVYPGEAFRPTHSLNRIHRLVARLKARLRELGAPVEIVCEADRYRLQIDAPLHLDFALPGEAPWIFQWRQQFGMRSVSTREAARELGVSVRQVQLALSRHPEFFKSWRKGREIRWCLSRSG